MPKPEVRLEHTVILQDGSLSSNVTPPWETITSESNSITAVVSSLDEQGVEWLRYLAERPNPPIIQVVLLVHATCPTRQEHLAALLPLVRPTWFQLWVLPVREWGQRCCWILCVRRETPTRIFWTSSAGNFGLSAPAIEEAHAFSEADPLIVDQFLAWFSSLVFQAAPLSSETAVIPALVPARGTQEAARLWDDYESMCWAAAEVAKGAAEVSQPDVAEAFQLIENQTGDELQPPQSDPTFQPTIEVIGPGNSVTDPPKTAEEVEKQIREELKIPKSDPIVQLLVQLFERGDLVTIDKGTRIPPLEVPIKAEWFDIPSFREVGVVSREVRYKISILDEKANKQLEARRNGMSDLREKFSFPLADGSRWMPHKAKPLFEAELTRLEQEGKKLLSSIVSGDPDAWVQSKRELVTRDANRQYEEFHPGKSMPRGTIDNILKGLGERFRKATAGNFLPKVSFLRTSFRLSGDSDHVSEWATALRLLRAIAEYPRTALKSRAYFFRGLKVSEKELLHAMNVAEDRLVGRWFEADSLNIAQAELDVLGEVSESERSDRDKCSLILDLLHRSRPLERIVHLAQNKTEDLNVPNKA